MGTIHLFTFYWEKIYCQNSHRIAEYKTDVDVLEQGKKLVDVLF